MTAMRVVSLLPSITEIVCAVNGGSRGALVGVTHECDYPADVVSECVRVTTSEISPHTMTQAEIDTKVCGSMAMGHSLYGLDEAKLRHANPTIVFTQALCDVCAPSYPMVLDKCARVLGDNPRVISIEPGCVRDVIESVRQVGREMGLPEQGEDEARRLEQGFETIRTAVADAISSGRTRRVKAAFLEWTDPLFNGGHWIPDMLDMAGADYTMRKTCTPSVKMQPEELVEYDADYILIAPCGFDMHRAAKDARELWQHSWWTNLRAVKDRKVYALDGNAYYARPGPRLLQGTAIMARLFHGEALGAAIGPDLAPPNSWIDLTQE